MKYFHTLVIALLSFLISCSEVADLFDNGQEPVLGDDGIVLNKTSTIPYDTVQAWIEARNTESGPLRFEWRVENGGRILPPADGDTIRWVAPATGGQYCTFYVKVSNQSKSVDAPPRQIYVESITNPLIKITAPPNKYHVLLGEQFTITAAIEHPDDLKWIKLLVNLDGEKVVLDSVGNRQSTAIYTKDITAMEYMVGLREFTISAMANNVAGKTGSQSVQIYVEGVIPGDAGQR